MKARFLEAVALALSGNWPAAHALVQDHEGDPHADWIHAVVHRQEGDLDNARYWYRRCGRPFPLGPPPSEELQEIRAALLAGPTS